MVITEWDAQDRPREKMMANGAASLTDAELLAILLVTGKKGKKSTSVKDAAGRAVKNATSAAGRQILRDVLGNVIK